jgi:anti-sigma regulatory factor (Ser/Thr protein kinase)
MLTVSETVRATPRRPTCAEGQRVTGISSPDEQAPPHGVELVLSLSPRARSCRSARHTVRTFCVSHGLRHLADDAELLTSELVTNALRHAHETACLSVRHDHGTLCVDIRDDAVDAVPVPRVAAADEESGRGMRLVGRLADRWGVTWYDDGKSVWFELR